MKKVILGFIIILLSVSLSSCGMVNEFLATLGFDTHDYDAEKIIESYESDSEKALELSEMVKTLTLNSPEIPTFSGTKEAISLCRDSLLNYMLDNNYTKYTGNLDLLDRASTEYPYLRVATIIPADDFENEAYRYFGGKQKVTNENGKLFTYLDKVDAYTTVTEPVENSIEVEVISLEETSRTFRLHFKCSLDEEESEEYFALIIKRADDSCYFKYVEKSKNAQ